jgi:hypothetical protein
MVSVTEHSQPRGIYTENLRAQINNWCKLARGVKEKGIKHMGTEQGFGYIVNTVSHWTLLNFA